jgi:hypothetical protein
MDSVTVTGECTEVYNGTSKMYVLLRIHDGAGVKV